MVDAHEVVTLVGQVVEIMSEDEVGDVNVNETGIGAVSVIAVAAVELVGAVLGRGHKAEIRVPLWSSALAGAQGLGRGL